MCDPARMIAYQESWTQVQQAYCGGFMVSERGLQAVLYNALRAHLPGVHVVVEPTWTMVGGTQKTPDLVTRHQGISAVSSTTAPSAVRCRSTPDPVSHSSARRSAAPRSRRAWASS